MSAFRVEGKFLIAGNEKCLTCNGEGVVQEIVAIPCPKCDGTGDGPRGGKGTCNNCYGSGRRHKKTDNIVECKRCGGAGEYPANHTSYLPWEIYNALPRKVYRQDRDITFNESMLGIGCVYSCMDCGSAWKNLSDEEVIQNERKDAHHVQACKISRKTGDEDVFEMCDHVGIFVNRGGYSVRAVYADEIPGEQIASERGYDEGMAVGMEIASRGGNGTLGGVFRD